MEIKESIYGKTSDGSQVDMFTLVNDSGLKAEIINFGAIVVSLWIPDRDGKSGDIVLGFDSLEGYIEDTSYQGAIVGRVGNRIGGASFGQSNEIYKFEKIKRAKTAAREARPEETPTNR